MDSKAKVLNEKWKHFSRWTMVYSWILFPLMYYILVKLLPSLNSFWLVGDYLLLKIGIGFIGIISTLMYIGWFFVTSNELFALLDIDKKTILKANIFTVVFLAFFPLPILVITTYLWLEMGDFWLERMQEHTWLAVAKEK